MPNLNDTWHKLGERLEVTEYGDRERRFIEGHSSAFFYGDVGGKMGSKLDVRQFANDWWCEYCRSANRHREMKCTQCAAPKPKT